MNALNSIYETIGNGVLVVFRRKKVEPWEDVNVDSFEEIYANEEEILKRIKKTPNGGILFALKSFVVAARY